MKDEEIDALLNTAARAPHRVDPSLLERIAGSMKSSLRPVRLLPSTPVLAIALVLICAVVALAGAARAGFYGFAKMDLLERALIFATLAILAWVAATEFVNAMIPGSRRRVASGSLLGIGSVALLAVFALVFRDYQTTHFVSSGVVCLLTGVLHAIPTALLSWLVLRRGFAVNAVSAGLVAGTLAGLAGVGVLELHCPNFQAAHVLVWHTAVVPLSAALGALVAWALEFRHGSSHSDSNS